MKRHLTYLNHSRRASVQKAFAKYTSVMALMGALAGCLATPNTAQETPGGDKPPANISKSASNGPIASNSASGKSSDSPGKAELILDLKKNNKSIQYDPSILDIAFSKNGVVYLAAYAAGLVKSEDGGENWKKIEIDSRNGAVERVVTDGRGAVYIVYERGWELMKSDNGGATWRSARKGIGREIGLLARVSHLFVDTKNNIYAGSVNLWQSTDGAKNWSLLHGYRTGKNMIDISSIAVAENGNQYLLHGGGVQWIEPKGNTWTEIGWKNFRDTSHIAKLIIDKHETLFTADDDGIARKKLGQKWSTVFRYMDNHVWTIALDHHDFVYAAMYPGIWQSKDGGDNWAVYCTTESNIDTLGIDASGAVFAGTHEGKLYKCPAH